MDLVLFIGGKTLFFSMAFVIPMLLHPVWTVLATYAVAAFVSGIVLAIVFQLAHCVEEAEFPMPIPETTGPGGRSQMATGWAVHQVQTTVDFARGNPIVSWFCGGLNYQVEHHLFPKICHIHYPKLSKLVEEACKEFGIQYQEHRTFLSGVISHYKWLTRMGRTPQTVPAV
jgi:linoleoyl-CoA desaturase